MNISFENQVALVTGAGSGLDLATAKAFAESGASVALADWNEKTVQSAAEELAAQGHKTLAIHCDVADDAQVEAMVEQTVATFGRVMGPGWVAAEADNVKPGSTVAIVGDGAVGLLGALSAKQMGAERIIAMSRHASRQKFAREFGATDIVTERGDEGVACVKELTNGIGAD